MICLPALSSAQRAGVMWRNVGARRRPGGRMYQGSAAKSARCRSSGCRAGELPL
ncbi:hypothetical protein PVAP13_5KG587307 [Panicum virgatum]|uniref:Uncharacterized protein n=1 Tax=Panicum virgatum TaxID=38727 RepID=A0A8T0SPA9_PANVG|nr:hypothetical protein PVAP13_5KG587307 [Panicum virgatum]